MIYYDDRSVARPHPNHHISMKFMKFIDALDPSHVARYVPEMAEDMKGRYDLGVPCNAYHCFTGDEGIEAV